MIQTLTIILTPNGYDNDNDNNTDNNIEHDNHSKFNHEVFKGIGRRGSRAKKMRFLLILIDSVPNFQAFFYGIEKAFSVVELSRDEFSKNGKILYILGIFKFSIGDLKSYLIFGPRSVSGPHIWPSGCI